MRAGIHHTDKALVFYTVIIPFLSGFTFFKPKLSLGSEMRNWHVDAWLVGPYWAFWLVVWLCRTFIWKRFLMPLRGLKISRGLVFADKCVDYKCLRKWVEYILASFYGRITHLSWLEKREKLQELFSCKLNNDFYDVLCKFRQCSWSTVHSWMVLLLTEVCH